MKIAQTDIFHGMTLNVKGCSQMRFKVEYNPDFFDDIVQIVDWYNEKQETLGNIVVQICTKQLLS